MRDQFGKAFCVLPWIHSFVNIGGEYQVCCTSEEFHDGILNSENKIYNIKQRPSIDEVMNSDFMKKLRLELLDGRMPKLCTRCIVTENHQGTSRRQLENIKYEEHIPRLIDMTKPDGTIQVDIKSADYRLGNICNLQCRMCNPRSTVMWINDWNNIKTGQEIIHSTLQEEYQNYNWIDENYLIEEFEEKILNVDILHFAGGEPLIAPRMRQMLQLCIDRNIAHKITLTYNTNVTKLPPKVLELWKQFKAVKLFCSIDGFDTVNEYIRMPSKWETIDRNLRLLDEQAKELNISEILISTTVQAYNILNLDQLYSYLRTFKNITPAPNLINLYSPNYLGTQVLPQAVKAKATERLLAVKETLSDLLPDYHLYLVENIDQILSFMNSKDLNDSLWPQFIEFNDKLDAKKGMSLQDSIPELAQATKEAVRKQHPL